MKTQNPQHPDAKILVAYKSGELPEPHATTIEAHLSACDTCLDTFAKISAADPIERRLLGRVPAADEIAQPVASWIDKLRARSPFVAPRAATDDFVRRLAPSDHPNELGQFGRYRIIKRIGRGGMGTVYLAHDTQLDRDVALKVPAFAPDDGPEILERFVREAQAAATINHPNICPVFDVGEINGIHFLTMAHIDGRPLSDFIGGDKPLPQRQVATAIKKIALALEEAHQRGVIHRDLKPSNIMINKRREPVIMDFGLARRVKTQDVRLTQSGTMLGTPAYMPPEQVNGELAAMGPRSDVYSLGVILYELLAGRLPFEGPLAAVLAQILTQEPKPLISLRADLDPALESICRKAMAKKPSDRFGSMQELAAALTEFLKKHPELARPATSLKSDTSRSQADPDILRVWQISMAPCLGRL